MVIGYLTNLYGRASDSFIRCEVAALRDLGHVVHTFTVREADPGEAVSEDIRAEREQTEVILDGDYERLVAALGRGLVQSPRSLVAATALALQTAGPGTRAHAWQFAYLLEAARVAESLRRRRVEHLHNHFGAGSAMVAMLASTITGIPFSLTIHGGFELENLPTLALPKKARRATFVAAASWFARSQVLRCCDPADWSKVYVVRCGVAQQFLNAPPSPVPDTGRLVCVARLSPEKGHLVLIDAVGRLVRDGRRDVELVLAGDGPLRVELEREIAARGLLQTVRIAGWQSADEIRDLILAARGVVLPSFSEGIPVTLMEALALHRPVVATAVGGVGELVADGVNGWLVPPGSPAALADALAEVLAAPVERLQAMGRAGAARVSERHDASTEARKLERLMRATRQRGHRGGDEARR